MIIKELQVLSEALWESIKTDLGFFAPIQVFAKRLAEIDFTNPSSLEDLTLYSTKIDQFFSRYRSRGDNVIYIPPAQASKNDTTVRTICHLVKQLASLSKPQLEIEFAKGNPNEIKKSKNSNGKIFLGHGRSKLWMRVQLFLKEDLNLSTLAFEDESRTSESIVTILEEFLDKSSLAILIMTGDDETSEGKSRARQNVIHEAGLFQGRLGFDKVIILKQDGLEEFSNIAGLQYIPFNGENIEQCFYELQRKLKKIGIIR